MLVLLGLTADIMIGLLVEPVLPVFLQSYLPIAIAVTLDVILGGTRAWSEGTSSDWVFVVSFLSNVFIAGLIASADGQIGVGSQLSAGVVVVFGTRIFNNAAATRRVVLHA